MSVRLLDPAAMSPADWPAGSEMLRAYAGGFAERGATRLVANLRTELRVLHTGDAVLPVTINDSDYDNTYVCSPYTAYATYAKEETSLLHDRWWCPALAVLADSAGAILKRARINRMVQVNNWMLSTNLFRRDATWNLDAITAVLREKFPDHFICFRSLNAWSDAALLQRFRASGYKLVASRPVYVFEDFARTWLRTHNAKLDRRALARTEFRVIAHDELGEADYERMAELYRQLYIEKYSRLNPQFTADYLRLCHRARAMTFFGLRATSGTLDGVLGLFAIDGIVTAPIVGYDTSRDARCGLYRLLMTLTFDFAMQRGLRLNLSSGAAHFKRLRGGRPQIEYSAIYDRHLSVSRRLSVSALAATVNGLGVPLMRKFQL